MFTLLVILQQSTTEYGWELVVSMRWAILVTNSMGSHVIVVGDHNHKSVVWRGLQWMNVAVKVGYSSWLNSSGQRASRPK